MVLYVDGMIEQYSAGFAGIMEDDVLTDSLFKRIFVLLELVEDLLIIGDVKTSVNLLFLSVDIDADVVGGRSETEIIPVLRLRLTKIKFPKEVWICSHLLITSLPEV